MSKSVVTTVIVVLVVLAGGGVLLAMNSSSDKSNKDSSANMNDMNMNKNSSSNSSNTQSSTSNNVTIENFAFSPANTTVKKGTTVTWTNKDSVTHDVTETDGKNGPQSGNLAPGKTYTFTFDSTGMFKYFCSIHPNMVGTVTVTE